GPTRLAVRCLSGTPTSCGIRTCPRGSWLSSLPHARKWLSTSTTSSTRKSLTRSSSRATTKSPPLDRKQIAATGRSGRSVCFARAGRLHVCSERRAEGFIRRARVVVGPADTVAGVAIIKAGDGRDVEVPQEHRPHEIPLLRHTVRFEAILRLAILVHDDGEG